MFQQDLMTEMRGLREQVPGVTGTLVAAVDGLLVAADTDTETDTGHLAAVAAASLGTARRIIGVTCRGALGRAVIYASRGHVAVYAIGDVALLAVLGDEELNVATLHRQSQPALGRIRHILTRGQDEQGD